MQRPSKYLWISWPVLLGASAALFVLQMVMGKLSEPGSTAPSARWRAFSRRGLLGTLARRVGEELAAAIPGGQPIDVRLGPDGLDGDARLTGISSLESAQTRNLPKPNLRP